MTDVDQLLDGEARARRRLLRNEEQRGGCDKETLHVRTVYTHRKSNFSDTSVSWESSTQRQ